MTNPTSFPIVSHVAVPVTPPNGNKRRSSIDEPGTANLQLSKRVSKKEFTPVFPPPPVTAKARPLGDRDIAMVDQSPEASQKTISVSRRLQPPANHPSGVPTIPAAAGNPLIQPEEKSEIWKFEKPLEHNRFPPLPSQPAKPSPLIPLPDGSTIQQMPNGMVIQRFPDGKISVTGFQNLPISRVSLEQRASAPKIPQQLFSLYSLSDKKDGEFENDGSGSEDESLNKFMGNINLT